MYQMQLTSLCVFNRMLCVLSHIYDIYIMYINACVHAKVLQSCPTLCDTVDSSPPGYSVHGILQARILEWVANSFSKQNNPSHLHFLHSIKFQTSYHLTNFLGFFSVSHCFLSSCNRKITRPQLLFSQLRRPDHTNLNLFNWYQSSQNTISLYWER